MVFESLDLYSSATEIPPEKDSLDLDRFWFGRQVSVTGDFASIVDRARDYIRFDRTLSCGLPDSTVRESSERIKLYDAENERRHSVWSDADLVDFMTRVHPEFAAWRQEQTHVH